MTRPIRYARTEDGVNIAFTELGGGPDVICMPPLPFSHIEELWRLPGATRWYERLARSARVILYDARGTGLSDREGKAAVETSLEAMRRDLEAVIAAAAAELTRNGLADRPPRACANRDAGGQAGRGRQDPAPSGASCWPRFPREEAAEIIREGREEDDQRIERGLGGRG